MPSFARFNAVLLCCFLAITAGAQTSRPQAKPGQTAAQSTPAASAPRAATPPQFRPSVLAFGPDSLVNRIDAKALLAKGQKDGAVQFAVSVGRTGGTGDGWTYNRLPGSEALEEEVLQRLGESRFTTPIYNHQPVGVVLYGTVVFSAQQTPNVRIFLNQDPEEIQKGNDYIGPQPVIGGDSKFDGFDLPETLPVAIEGVVSVALNVDLKGNPHQLELLNENPPLLGFRDAAVKDLIGAKFIPAFRDGDPVESTSVMSICYKPIGVAPEPEGSTPGLGAAEPSAPGLTFDIKGATLDLRAATPKPQP